MNRTTQQNRPTFKDIFSAQQRISGPVKNTPLIESLALNNLLGCKIWCKCENLQGTGSFKLRGASNAISRLREQGISSDVATHSSGNHGAALARAARLDGRNAWVVMPENAVAAKIEAVKRYGGKVVFCEPNQLAREEGLARLVKQGFIPIPPYDHPDIIAGQGTVALEILSVKTDLDILMTPVGGGGLISGSAIIARHLNPAMTIIGAEPLGAADAAESFSKSCRVTTWQPDTIADGLRALVGELTFPIILDLVNQILTVTEEGLINAMELIFEHLDMTIEPSSATVIAAIMEYPAIFAEKEVGIVLSGGNIDTHKFPHLTKAGND